MAIDERLAGVFRQVFGDPEMVLHDEMNAHDVENWDSIAHIQLIFAVEEEYQIRLSTKDLEQMRNVGDLQTTVDRLAK